MASLWGRTTRRVVTHEPSEIKLGDACTGRVGFLQRPGPGTHSRKERTDMRTGGPHPGTVQDPDLEGTGTLTAQRRSLDFPRIRTITYYISYSSTYTLENFGWTPSLGVRQISNIISPHSIDACTCYTHNYLTIIVPLRSSAKKFPRSQPVPIMFINLVYRFIL